MKKQKLRNKPLPTRYGHSLTALILPLVLATDALAQTADGDPSALDSIIVTGTRLTGLKAADSPAPVQIIDAATLQHTGQPDLVSALTQALPSFTSDGKGGDAAALTTAARLRGLSPNHTLILVNGKRRHGTSNLNVGNGTFGGGAAADLGFIPVSAIDHVEVLTDGAAAQYGSDAIAGVINIILKENAQGGSVSYNTGRYFDGGGNTGDIAANFGLQPSEASFLNVSVESKYHGHSDRSDYDARFVPPYLKAADSNVTNAPGYPHVNQTFGDARIRQDILSANGGIQIRDDLQLYGLLTYGTKRADAIQNYRGPSTAAAVYPLGFSPVEAHEETDHAITAGLKGKTANNWNFDLSATYGRDYAKVLNWSSINAQLLKDTGSSPTSFYEGYLQATQATTNIDFNKDFEIGWSTPLNVALGAEHRTDGYAIGAGDAASVYRGGAAAFPGYSQTDAGSHFRSSNSLYIDLAGSPISKLRLDTALRAEHYSDFGSAAVGKLTARYDVAPTWAVRGTVSNGFRAPTLAEEYYSATSVSPTTASVILPSASAAARLTGLDPLKAEKSQNISLGIVATPLPRLTTSLDVYQINIRDRILQSGTINGLVNGVVQSAIVNAAIAANGNTIPAGVTSSGVSIYSNAADTRNTGADLLISYASDYGSHGKVDWTGALNVNRVQVTRIKATPSQLGSQKIVDQTARSYLEDASPEYRINLGALWRKEKWTVNLRENIFGSSSYYSTIDNSTYYLNRIGTKLITDLDVSYQVTKDWTLTVGANNLFNVYPDELNSDYRQALNKAGRQNVAKYPSFSPIGINGGYYFAKATFRF